MEDAIMTTAMDLGIVGVLLLVLWKWSQKMFTVVENNTAAFTKASSDNEHHEAGARDRATVQVEASKEHAELLRKVAERTKRCGLVKAEIAAGLDAQETA